MIKHKFQTSNGRVLKRNFRNSLEYWLSNENLTKITVLLSSKLEYLPWHTNNCIGVTRTNTADAWTEAHLGATNLTSIFLSPELLHLWGVKI